MSANGLRPYPAYRASGPDWLGKVPAHWEVRRIKFLLRERHARSALGREQLLRVSQYTGITKRRRKDTRAESLIGYRRVAPSDLVVNIMLAWNGSLGVSSFDGIVSPAYCVYRFGAHTHPPYVHYLLRSPLYRTRIKTVSTGVVESRLRLYTDDLYRLEALLPPLPEQRAIARFLDTADRRIRRYIRAKERLIELLEERKRTLIHEAVTGRIDVRTGQPYPAYKDSGVEWIGKVPEHREAKRIKTLARSGYKTFVDGDWIESPYITSDGIRLIQTGNVGIGEYREQGFRYISERTFDEFGCTEFDPGDVLICRLGLPVARACLAPSLGKRMITSVDVCILRPRGGVSPAYLVYTMSSRRYLGWVASLVRGSTRDRVSRSMLGGFTVPVPPSSEQNRVADYLDEVVGALKTTIRGTEQSIKLIRQYRTRLIADVVTGKLDVREAAADLPGIDPLAGNRDRAEAIPIESNLHSTAHDMVKEAVS